MINTLDERRYLTDFDSTRTGHILTDVLVIGSGVAGARAAVEAARTCDVLLLNKAELAESTTYYAQGGIATAGDDEAAIRRHIDDTLRVGCGLADPQVVEQVVREGPARVAELIDWGTQFDRRDGRLLRTREGGHSVPRILHARGDATGKEIARALLEKVRGHERVRIFEHCFLIDLITVEGCCRGAVAFHPQHGHQLLWAGQTILATGGCGRLYRETTNPATCTGDGLAAAYRAGALLADMEMVQFHPTTLYVAGASRALISEAVRGEGAYLVDRDGHRFMPDHHPDGELAPRDVVSRAIHDRLAKTNATCVYLDARHIPKERFAKRFPHITELCAAFDIDVGRHLIPVRPSAHYMIGGVVAGPDTTTSVPGLLCCGEAACTGLHGANRLASNSLLEGLVFGKIAGQTAERLVRDGSGATVPARVVNRTAPSQRTELDLADIRNSLRSLIWRNVGITRTADRLRETNEIIEFWGHYVLDKVFDDSAGWETQNMLGVGRLIALSALHRTESCGVHFREDAPADAATTPRHTTVRRDGMATHGWADLSFRPIESVPSPAHCGESCRPPNAAPDGGDGREPTGQTGEHRS